VLDGPTLLLRQGIQGGGPARESRHRDDAACAGTGRTISDFATFFIKPNRPGPPDLDNLLKPVLDTLFTSDNVVGPTGVLVEANDTYVTEVRARKTEAPVREQEGADIIVTWRHC